MVTARSRAGLRGARARGGGRAGHAGNRPAAPAWSGGRVRRRVRDGCPSRRRSASVSLAGLARARSGRRARRWDRRRPCGTAGGLRSSAARAATATATELAEALGRITEELRAGAHPAAALGGTGADGPLARAVLAPAAAAAALGDGVPAALAAEAARHPGVAGDLSRIARSWALADRHGVPPVELLVAVHADIRWRVAYAGRVRAQLAGPRATAAVLTALPALGIALGELVGAGPLAVLRSGVLGQLLVVVGVGLAAAGAAWTERILRGAVPR